MVVRMDHYNYIRALLEGQAVACFLVGAVAHIVRVCLDQRVRQRLRDSRGFILAGIIYNNYEINDLLLHHFVISHSQSLRGIVCRHHHYHFLSLEHLPASEYIMKPRSQTIESAQYLSLVIITRF